MIERVLRAAAASEPFDAAGHAAWEVGQLLDALERAGLEPARLAGLEFTFFALLEDIRAPRALVLRALLLRSPQRCRGPP